MDTIEQLTLKVKELSALLRTQANEITKLKQQAEAKSSETERLLAESKKAQEFAMKSFRIDHDGWVWRYDFERKLYVKTTNRINTPIIPYKSIEEKHIVNGAVTSTKIREEAIMLGHLSKTLIRWIVALVDNKKTVVFLTQAEYNALTEKDPNVVYVIYEDVSDDETQGENQGENQGGGESESRPNTGDISEWRFDDSMPIILS